MEHCYWENCKNEGNNLVQRHATVKEQEEGTTFDGYVATVPLLFQRRVCDEHLEKARKEYPIIPDEPSF